MTYVIAAPCVEAKVLSCVEACPVDGCFAEDQVPDEWQKSIPINVDDYKNS